MDEMFNMAAARIEAPPSKSKEPITVLVKVLNADVSPD